jgi:hypothetical protein
MLGLEIPRQLLLALLICCIAPFGSVRGQSYSVSPQVAPGTESLLYNIEWRLITAGTAKLMLEPARGEHQGSRLTLRLESAGIVSKLYKVDDVYTANYDRGTCAASLTMLAQEGRRKRDTRVTYDHNRNKADYLERDLVKNTIVKQTQTDIPHCVNDVAGALFALRAAQIEVGHSAEVPVSDGRKFAQVRVEAQEREELKIKDKPVKTVRYEAFLFNNVIYARKARLFVWLTDDAAKVPVQIRLRMSFPVGTITLTLDKEEHL